MTVVDVTCFLSRNSHTIVLAHPKTLALVPDRFDISVAGGSRKAAQHCFRAAKVILVVVANYHVVNMRNSDLLEIHNGTLRTLIESIVE